MTTRTLTPSLAKSRAATRLWKLRNYSRNLALGLTSTGGIRKKNFTRPPSPELLAAVEEYRRFAQESNRPAQMSAMETAWRAFREAIGDITLAEPTFGMRYE